VPGVGDFNLRAFFRALGIKNPQPSMREFVQPVIIAGDMSEITPQYRPPEGVFGGDIAGVSLEFSWVQVISRAEGGTLAMGGADTAVRYGTFDTPLSNNIITSPYPIAVQSSAEPPVSLVQTGSEAAVPIATNRSPSADAIFDIQSGGMGARFFWIRPGTAFAMWGIGANASVNRFWLRIVDIPASENSIL